MGMVGNVHLRILGIHEEDQWCAIALELSLRGYGKTFKEACDDLKETILVQARYALEHYQSIDHILIPAESHYFDMHANAEREELRNHFSKRTPSEPSKYVTGSMPIPRLPSSLQLA